MQKIVLIILFFILVGIGLNYVNEQVRRNKCYELTPKDFYNNPVCKKYVEEYEDD